MIDKYLKIKEASQFLGVCKSTLRAWNHKGIIKSYRNPVNNYRYFKREDLEALKNKITQSMGE